MTNTPDKAPKAIWEGEFKIFGKRLRCYVLDNGQRIIDAKDMESLFYDGGDINDTAGLEDFTKWQKGIDNDKR